MINPVDIANELVFKSIILNLDKVFLLDYTGQNIIMEIWRTMLYSASKLFNTNTSLSSSDNCIVDLVCSYNTLNDYGFLTTRRDKNLEQLT